jgi:hypothetical protein
MGEAVADHLKKDAAIMKLTKRCMLEQTLNRIGPQLRTDALLPF